MASAQTQTDQAPALQTQPTYSFELYYGLLLSTGPIIDQTPLTIKEPARTLEDAVVKLTPTIARMAMHSISQRDILQIYAREESTGPWILLYIQEDTTPARLDARPYEKPPS